MNASLNQSPQTQNQWRDDITGLRALAVIPVLIFHAFPNLLPGGFFGVDIFFVISGYLIAGIIFRGLVDNKFSFLDFYVKRIRRIIPNLLPVLFFVAILGALFMTANEFERLGKHIQSSTFFYENFRLLNESDYFDIASRLKPLLHLWSLAIEEQFYIFFPAITAGLWIIISRLTASKRAPIVMLGIMVTVLIIGSFVFCIIQKDPTKAFYYPQCRFWEIGFGILLVYCEVFHILDFHRVSKNIRHTISVIGLLLIVGSIVLYSKEFRTPGWLSLLPTLGTVLLIAVGPQALMNRFVLSWRPMIFIGLISYSLYLWHWPLLSFMHIIHPNPSALDGILRLLIAFVIATAIYYWIELPVRRASKIVAKRLVIFLLLGMLLSWGIGKALQLTRGLPSRPFCRFTVDILPVDNEGSHIRKMGAIRLARDLYKVTTLPSQPSILFVGDSHQAQYSALIENLSIKSGKSATIIVAYGLGRFATFESSVSSTKNNCPQFYKTFEQTIEQKNIKTLVLSSAWSFRKNDKSLFFKSKTGESIRFDQGGFELALDDLFTRLANLRPELKIYVLLDNPHGEEFNPFTSGFNRWATYLPIQHVHAPVPIKSGQAWEKVNEIVRKRVPSYVSIIDVTPQLFPDGRVPFQYAYYDSNHLNSKWLADHAKYLDVIFGLRR